MEKTALISPCGRYRYRLTRRWGPGALLPFVMLNPSTADADVDDATIRRCMSFARREERGGIVVGNLFAYRATDPEALRAVADPVGPSNVSALTGIIIDAAFAGVPVLCGWGAYSRLKDQDAMLRRIAAKHGVKLVCLGTTMAGYPRHPLYVRRDQPLVEWGPRR